MAKLREWWFAVAFLTICNSVLKQVSVETSAFSSQDFHNYTEERDNISLEEVINVEVNFIDLNQTYTLRSLLESITFPIPVSMTVNVTSVTLTTVCHPHSTGFQCRCEEEFAWLYNSCVTYGTCDNITNGTCGCINQIPFDGQYCQPYTRPQILYEYAKDIEIHTTNPEVVDALRILLRNLSLPLLLTNTLNITDAEITTVCLSNSTGSQCRCEGQFAWSYNSCVTYGACDYIADNTCRCINSIPADGQLCQPNSNGFSTTTTTMLPSTSTTMTEATTTTGSTTMTTTEYTISTTTEATTTQPTTLTTKSTTLLTTTPTTTSTTLPTSTLTTTSTTPPTTTLTTTSTTHTTTLTTTSTTPPTTTLTTTSTTHTTTLTTTSTTHTTTLTTTSTTPPTTALTTTSTTTPTTTSTTTPTTTSTTTPTTTSTTTLTTTSTTPPTTVTPRSTSTTTMTTSTTTTTTATTAPTKMTTKAPTTTTTTTTITPQSFSVELSFRVDRTFTDDLNDPASLAYRDLKDQTEKVLQSQYGNINGFLSATVTGFRQGSVIIDSVIRSSSLDADEMAEANNGLPSAMTPVATVIGSINAVYNSITPISIPDPIYTGRAVTLTCGPVPQNIQIGETTGSKWKLNGREIQNNVKFQISSDGSNLSINNIIPADSGLYECALKGEAIDFVQKGDMKRRYIKTAPLVDAKSQVNIPCEVGKMQPLQCCVQSPYEVQWWRGSVILPTDVVSENCIVYNVTLERCSEPEEDVKFTCRVKDPPGFFVTTTVTIFRARTICNNTQYGSGREGDISKPGCGPGQEGNRTAVCEANGEWRLLEDTCIVKEIKDLLSQSQVLESEDIPEFVEELNTVSGNLQTEITNSTATLSAIVDILDTIAKVTTNVSELVMEDILETVDVLISDEARDSWVLLNANETRNTSSMLLDSLESITNVLEGEFVISTQRTLLNRTTFTNSFTADINSSIIINIPDTNITNLFITTIGFSTLNNILPPRNGSFNVSDSDATGNETVIDNVINGFVVLVKVNATINNVTLKFNKVNSSLTESPQCVFWNFSFLDNLGGWDDEGCTFVSDIDNIVTCNCNHLTSFSMLMSPFVSHNPILAYITVIGVALSLGSLVICLIIEAFVWKALTRNGTAYMRHVAIVNIAVSLLISDIWFIVGAAISDQDPTPLGPCSAATFFIHFFYLAMFFWMLITGVLLLRTISVFSQMSKSAMLGTAFTVGYGAPLIIAVVTVASTGPGNNYIRNGDICWLNWYESYALLAFVIPALIIVVINIFILIFMIFKITRRQSVAGSEDRNAAVVIARSLAVLTPIFGVTWGLGIGTMVDPTNDAIHGLFAFFNSLQGVFILVFGTLLDKKIRQTLTGKTQSASAFSSNPTRSTNTGTSSTAMRDFFQRIRGNVYNVAPSSQS